MNGNGRFSIKKMYKSEGERKIAALLDRLDIKYNYEPGILVNDGGYQRIWYPDFKLPQYSVFIEYLGIENDLQYDERTKHKLDTYRKMGIDVIPIYPSTLQGNYKRYIVGEIHRIISNRLSDLESKIYHHYLKSSVNSPSKFKSYSFQRLW